MTRYYSYDAWKTDDPRDEELGVVGPRNDPRPDRSDAPWLRKGPLPVACEHCDSFLCHGECRDGKENSK